jgi:hypothetical protein
LTRLPRLPHLLLALLLLPAGGAQVLSDPTGDVALGTEPAPAALGRFEHIDLAGLAVDEDAEGLRFEVALAGVGSGMDEVRVRESHILVPFSVGGQAYELAFERASGTFLHHRVLLDRVAANGTRDLLLVQNDWEDGQPQVDRARNTLSAFLPRSLLSADAPAPAVAGSPLVVGAVSGRSYATSGFTGFLPLPPGPDEAWDRMPDDGGGAELALRFGVPARSVAVEPAGEAFRTSNGEATTFLFRFNVTALAGPVDVRFEVADRPDGWQVDLTRTGDRLEPGSPGNVAVLATTPFAHGHGRLEWATLLARDASGAVVGGAHFGVRYTEIARPAGHHDALFIHSRQVGTGLEFDAERRLTPNDSGLPYFLSTLEQDARSDGAEIVGQPESVRGGDAALVRWKVPLNPRLDIGLDLDGTRAGSLAMPMRVERGGGAATVGGRLILVGVDGGGETRPDAPLNGRPVLELGRLADTRVQLSSSWSNVESALTLAAGRDRIPFTPDSDLVLDLWLRWDAPAPPLTETAPRIASGSRLDVPLDEFHDLEDGSFRSGPQAPALEVGAAPVLRAEPGATVAWDVSTGAGAALRVVGSNAFRLDGARVLATVPTEARPGDVLVAFLLAEDGGGQAARRLAVQVVDAQPDSGHYVDATAPGRESPLPPALALLPILGALLARRRQAADGGESPRPRRRVRLAAFGLTLFLAAAAIAAWSVLAQEGGSPPAPDAGAGWPAGFPRNDQLVGQELIPDFVPGWNVVAHRFGFLAGNPGPVQPGVFYSERPPGSVVGAAYGSPTNDTDFTLVFVAEMASGADADAWFAGMDHCSVGTTTKWVSQRGATVHTVETKSKDPAVLANLDEVVGQVRADLGMSDRCRAAAA